MVTADMMITMTEAPVGYDLTVTPDLAGGRLVYVARHPALRGCMSHGDTPEEAIASLSEALELWLEAAREGGIQVPPPHPNPSEILVSPSVLERPSAPRPNGWRVTFQAGA